MDTFTFTASTVTSNTSPTVEDMAILQLDVSEHQLELILCN